jgi:hypothetical protein
MSRNLKQIRNKKTQVEKHNKETIKSPTKTIDVKPNNYWETKK